jgi:hypothetical protein
MSQVPLAQRWRAPVAHDERDEGGELIDARAFKAIEGGAPYALVLENMVAVDGRAMRQFEPVWKRVRELLQYTGAQRKNPVSLSSSSVRGSLAQLLDARESLARLGPPKTRGVGMGLFVGALAAMATAGLIGAAAGYQRR